MVRAQPGHRPVADRASPVDVGSPGAVASSLPHPVQWVADTRTA
jgi:hypothetical protein